MERPEDDDVECDLVLLTVEVWEDMRWAMWRAMLVRELLYPGPHNFN